jgi:hypothetical protein
LRERLSRVRWPEIIAGNALLGTLVLLCQRRFALTTVTLTTAIMTGTCLLSWLIARLRRQTAPFPLTVALILALWQLFPSVRWGTPAALSSRNQGRLPLQGFASLLYHNPSQPFASVALATAKLLT